MPDLTIWVFSTVLVAVAASLICQMLFYKTKKAVWLPGCLTGLVFPITAFLGLYGGGGVNTAWLGLNLLLLLLSFAPGFLCGLLVSAIVGGVLRIFRK